MGKPHIEIDRNRLEELSRKYQIRRLALFGSVLREDFRTDSDIDVLVEFQPDAKVGLSFFRSRKSCRNFFSGRWI